MIHKNIFFPALVICLLVCLLMGFVLVLQTLCQKDLYFINKAFLGYDYYNFYQASICVENGLSPYAFPLHMVPPIPSILGTPLVPLGFLNARWIIVILVLLTTIFFYWIMVSYFAPKETQDKWAILACGFASLFLSYPFLFLLDRANVDSFAVFFMCLLLVYSHKSVLLSGMLLTLAVCFKVYPALLLLPLAIFKKNKILLWSGIFLLIFIAITPI